MTDRPKLYPSHQHQWTDAHPELFTNSLVRCTVCGFTAPRNAAGLDGQMVDIDELIERSSLGTPEAKALRAQADPEQVARILARAKELEREATHSGDRMTQQVYDASGCNVTPTDPGYCEFYDQFGAHAYMGGRSEGDPAREHEEGWTTCCDVDTEEQPEQETRTDA